MMMIPLDLNSHSQKSRDDLPTQVVEGTPSRSFLPLGLYIPK